jgi:hypothetical protein
MFYKILDEPFIVIVVHISNKILFPIYPISSILLIARNLCFQNKSNYIEKIVHRIFYGSILPFCDNVFKSKETVPSKYHTG